MSLIDSLLIGNVILCTLLIIGGIQILTFGLLADMYVSRYIKELKYKLKYNEITEIKNLWGIISFLEIYILKNFWTYYNLYCIILIYSLNVSDSFRIVYIIVSAYSAWWFRDIDINRTICHYLNS